MTGATNPSVVALSGLYRLVRRTIEAINLVAQSWGRASVGPGDEILISHLGHHANIVPWQQRAAERGARLRVIPVDGSGQILLDEYRSLLSDRTRLVAVTHVSNAPGTVVPVHQIVEQADAVGARVLIDGAQWVRHLRVDVQALDPDFYSPLGRQGLRTDRCGAGGAHQPAGAQDVQCDRCLPAGGTGCGIG